MFDLPNKDIRANRMKHKQAAQAQSQPPSATSATRAPQVKICGITRIDEAEAIARLEPDAVGVVFYSKSPRYVTPEQAEHICKRLLPPIARVGVFVDEPFEAIMAAAEKCGLDAIQLHGSEPPELVAQIRRQGLTVIKGLYMKHPPFFSDADQYRASAYLLECQKGILPGGNALTWNWHDARPFGKTHPFVLAGGLNRDNVEKAIMDACPDAVDVSSGVESSPGRKDIEKVAAFIRTVSKCRIHTQPRRIFR